MKSKCNTPFCKAVDALLLSVRIGDVQNMGVMEPSWGTLTGAADCELHQLRLRTALWDRYFTQGDYDAAHRELCKDGIVEKAIAKLEASVIDPDAFLNQNFPGNGKVTPTYRYWRQCVMGALAFAYSRFLIHESDYEERLNMVATFLDTCLSKPGYTCNGVRARLHYFRGIIYETNYEMDSASAQYELSVSHLISRAERKLANPRSPKYQAERNFVIYCLGKIELRLAQLDYERGRLTTGKRHAWEAGLLLRSSKDIYLPNAADLLTYQIRRYQSDFKQKGWQLVKEISKNATMVAGHVRYRLAARIEHIITCVYLRHLNVEPPGNDPDYLTLEGARVAVDRVIVEASGPTFQRTKFAALLVKARTLNRLEQWPQALAVLSQAEKILKPLPKPLEAELQFTKGKIMASRGHNGRSIAAAGPHWREAYECFRLAEEKEHCSLTFRIACRLQMADALYHMDKVVDAAEKAAEASKELELVEHSFLHRRLARIERKINRSSTFVSRLDGKFYERERDRFFVAYLLGLARHFDLRIEELRPQFRRVKPSGLITHGQLQTLLKHYKIYREEQSPVQDGDDDVEM
jgi:hypothetical protein